MRASSRGPRPARSRGLRVAGSAGVEGLNEPQQGALALRLDVIAPRAPAALVVLHHAHGLGAQGFVDDGRRRDAGRAPGHGARQEIVQDVGAAQRPALEPDGLDPPRKMPLPAIEGTGEVDPGRVRDRACALEMLLRQRQEVFRGAPDIGDDVQIRREPREPGMQGGRARIGEPREEILARQDHHPRTGRRRRLDLTPGGLQIARGARPCPVVVLAQYPVGDRAGPERQAEQRVPRSTGERRVAHLRCRQRPALPCQPRLQRGGPGLRCPDMEHQLHGRLSPVQASPAARAARITTRRRRDKLAAPA